MRRKLWSARSPRSLNSGATKVTPKSTPDVENHGGEENTRREEDEHREDERTESGEWEGCEGKGCGKRV